MVFASLEKLYSRLDGRIIELRKLSDNTIVKCVCSGTEKRGNHYEESISYTDKAIQKYLDQGSSYIYDALYIQGLNFYNISNWKEALKCFEILVRAYPEDAKIKKIHNEIMTKIKKDDKASDSTSVK